MSIEKAAHEQISLICETRFLLDFTCVHMACTMDNCSIGAFGGSICKKPDVNTNQSNQLEHNRNTSWNESPVRNTISILRRKKKASIFIDQVSSTDFTITYDIIGKCYSMRILSLSLSLSLSLR